MPEFILDKDMAMTFAGLSASAARNRLFAQKAKAAGAQQTALLLDALAEGEEIMARRALIAMRGGISDLDAYRDEIAGTKNRSAVRCGQYAEKAKQKGEDGIADTYERFAAVLQNHGERLAGDEGEGPSALHVCQVCGYVAAGEVPERCPVCHAVAKKFKTREP